MRAFLFLTYCLAAMLPATAQEKPAAPAASCSLDSHGAPCRITWNFAESPRTYYWIQQFDTSGDWWRPIEGPLIDPIGTAKEIAPDGFIYRVLACNDLAARTDCVSSTVHWAAVRFASVDSIPASMQDTVGQTMAISKNLDLGTQVIQYNVYRLVQVMEEIDLTSMPPMTEPPQYIPAPTRRLSLEDEIHINVYSNYAVRRSADIAAKVESEQIDNQ